MKKPQILKNKETRPASAEGVIITVYVATQSSHQNTDLHRKIKPNAQSKTTQTRKSTGYDRRAQLLAYSRDLRSNADSVHGGQFPRTKKSKLKIRRMLQRSRSKCRYERMRIAEVVDLPCLPKCFRSSAKKHSAKSESSLFMKLKSKMAELSRGCKRNKG